MNGPLIIQEIIAGNIKTLARTISLVENGKAGYEEILQQLPSSQTKITGITGPPGAGKSTLADALIAQLLKQQKKVGVLCIDPSSPFNHGALLGDRIRMNQWYTHPDVFIRSLANRGSLGGLSPKIIEITDLMKAAPFDHIIIETVGVGQSEVEIAGLSDTTVVVLVPEAGDEIQNMKAGLMEIADVFVVNKADRPDAARFVNNLRQMLAPAFREPGKIPAIVQTIAAAQEGIAELLEKIQLQQQAAVFNPKKNWLLAEKAYQLIQFKKMEGISKEYLAVQIHKKQAAPDFNLYRFVQQLLEQNHSQKFT